MSDRMRMVVALWGSLFAFALVGCEQTGGSRGAASDEADLRVAGTIGGEEITVDELDSYIRDALWARATKGGNAGEEYELRRREFDRMVSQRALEAEAEAQGLAADELLTRESSRGIETSEEKLRAFYDANKSRLQGRSYEAAAPMLRDFLERQDREANAQRYLAGLRDREKADFILPRTRVEVAGRGPRTGSAEAPVTIIEFSDYECPYCRSAEAIVAEVKQRYPEHVRIEYRHFPLESIHPAARGAAEAASCADDQDRFWEFHERVFESAPTGLGAEVLRAHAESAGLDLAAYDACVAERSTQARVDADLEAGREAGVEGTPTFFVNGIMVTGGMSADDFAKLIDEELERIRAGG